MRKDIFPFAAADGSTRWADPLAVHRRLSRLLGKLPSLAVADFLDDDPAKALPAAERLAAAACAAFDLGRPLDPATGEGVTEAVWRDALFAFVEWWEKNAQAASSSPTCSRPTPDSPPAPPAESSASAGTTPPA